MIVFECVSRIWILDDTSLFCKMLFIHEHWILRNIIMCIYENELGQNKLKYLEKSIISIIYLHVRK